MLHIWKNEKNSLVEIQQVCHGCWISVVDPSKGELDFLLNQLKLDPQFVRAALDEEETSRVEVDDEGTLLIVDLPLAEKQPDNTVLYSTLPLAFLVTGDYVVTIVSKENSIISELEEGLVKGIQPHFRTQFVLKVLYRIVTRYLQFLKQIDKISFVMEKQLHKSMRNKELFQLLELQKSLVYFSTSLKSNEVTLDKILRGRVLKLYEEDQDLLEDVLVEIKQAIEMCGIYSSILSGTMDTFASIISNNLNIVMKVLTAITILLAIPTMISGFYGMNVSGLPIPEFWFPSGLSLIAVLIVAIILIKSGMFSSK